jgi:tagatose 6-phosphate kinase
VILVVCLNPALDITHEVAAADWAGVNRPDAVHARPGGKGLNVARVLLATDTPVRVLGLAGGPTGSGVISGLSGTGVMAEFTEIGGETRRTFTVVDRSRETSALFNEPGPLIAPEEFAAFAAGYERALDGASAVVLSGSLPRGLAAGTYAALTATAAAAGVPVVLDTHGEALRLGAAAGPAIVKPNLAELEALAGRRLSRDQVAAAAADLRAAGAQAVVVSLGPDGLHAVTADGSWRAAPPAAVAGNATGAGDAVTAALVRGLVIGQPWPDRLRHAVALGTASAAAPVAGEFSPEDYARTLDAVTVRRPVGFSPSSRNAAPEQCGDPG